MKQDKMMIEPENHILEGMLWGYYGVPTYAGIPIVVTNFLQPATCPDCKPELKWRCKAAANADVDSSSGGCDSTDNECEKCPDREYICATCGKPLVDTLETGNPDGGWTCLDCGMN